jgi:probable rRNA maturation factor
MNKAIIHINTQEAKWKKEMPGVKSIIKKSCTATLQHTGIIKHAKEIDISVLLASDAYVKELNSNYRAQNKPTNVLSFPQEELSAGNYKNIDKKISLGDIVFALETVKQEAVQQNKDFGHHLAHLAVHGTLHLLGYDHEGDVDAEVMEALEIRILAGMYIESPY